ncbi:MAG: RHS repeat protein, partial [Dactylosporangium sp.]|nr:RHS repeat protein [Dactylosporangium sp.]
TTYSPHVEPGAPSGTLWWEPEWSVPAVTKAEFDRAGRQTASVFYAGDDMTNLVEKWRTTTAYEGDLTKTTPPAGGVPTTKVTDIHGRTVAQREHTTAAGVAGPYLETKYQYNRKDQMVKTIDPAGNEWTYKYDIKGRLIESVDPDKGKTTSQYNDYDELVKTTDARGEALWFVYDTLGRKTQVRDDSATGPLRAEFKYDSLYTGQSGFKGQLTQAIRYEPAGSTNAYKWQVRGFTGRYQPSGVNYVIPAVETGLNATYVYAYGYSAFNGEPTSITYPAGGGLVTEKVTTEYDDVTGLPVRLNTNITGQDATMAATWYTPYGENSLTTVKLPGGLYVDSSVEREEGTRRVRRTAVKPETATGTVSDRTYSYDDAGNITSIAENPQVGSADTQCFRYDELARLKTAWTPSPAVGCETDPAVANLAGPAPYWLDWTFDSVGNRKTEVSHAAAGDTTRTYTVPTGGAGVVRPHAVTQVSTAAPGQAEVVTRYSYDDAGNTVCRPAATAANTCPDGAGSQVLGWDAEGELATVANADGTATETNIYDANGVRLVRRDSTGTTLYLPGQEIRRDNSGTTTGTRYYTLAGMTCAVRTPAGVSWLYDDHQGTQQIAIDAATQAVSVRRQTPYGGARGSSPAWPTEKGFVGGDNDPTGLVNIGARQYDPMLGRFI